MAKQDLKDFLKKHAHENVENHEVIFFSLIDGFYYVRIMTSTGMHTLFQWDERLIKNFEHRVDIINGKILVDPNRQEVEFYPLEKKKKKRRCYGERGRK